MTERHVPKKSLGQNFLADPHYRTKIINEVKCALAEMFPDHCQRSVLEIGPGQGALTQDILPLTNNLILVEKDRDLAKTLNEKYGQSVVHEADFLEWPLSEYIKQKTLVVANLPYNVASQILFKLFEYPRLFPRLILMFQKEVALRCVAAPNTSDYSLMSVWCQVFADVKILFHLPPNAFRPAPKIYSSVVEFRLRDINPANEMSFIYFVKKLFMQRRKQLGNVLRGMGWKEENMPVEVRALLTDRAETLAIPALRKLFTEFAKACPGRHSGQAP